MECKLCISTEHYVDTLCTQIYARYEKIEGLHRQENGTEMDEGGVGGEKKR